MKKLLVISSIILGSLVGAVSMAGDVVTIEEQEQKFIMASCFTTASLTDGIALHDYKVEVSMQGFFKLNVELFVDGVSKKVWENIDPSGSDILTVVDEESKFAFASLPAEADQKPVATLTNYKNGKSTNIICKQPAAE